MIGNGLGGLWALCAHSVAGLRTKALWWFTLAVELVVFVEIGLGVWLVARLDREVADFHQFYGFVALVAIGIIYSYRSQLRERIYLLYGFGGLFIMGLGIRSMLL